MPRADWLVSEKWSTWVVNLSAGLSNFRVEEILNPGLLLGVK
jgi:hypothetical protein